MILGLMSDTHDRLDRIDKAVEFFNSQKLNYVLHAGDYIAPFTVKVLSRLNMPMIGVFGNNDGEKKGLLEKFKGFADVYESPHFFELKGYKIALMHAPYRLDDYSKSCRLVVYGHTHKTDIKIVNECVIVNPGETCGYITGKSTVCTVDIRTLKVSTREL